MENTRAKGNLTVKDATRIDVPLLDSRGPFSIGPDLDVGRVQTEGTFSRKGWQRTIE